MPSSVRMNNPAPDKSKSIVIVVMATVACGVAGFLIPLGIGLIMDIREGMHGPLGLIGPLLGANFGAFISPVAAVVGGVVAALFVFIKRPVKNAPPR
ncbi:hypothetical protein JQX13_14360 [Archangium violaceum]|uniref:hypothetical protein n=1 Tax=Archangium violaceum TaxID=83451 RepID=UPI00193B8642|nr:hypothetical protein [Archangium violaceum]QRK11145.1 hypothetical protein JQX13_14360 [Archangium violaceum]